MSPPPPEDVPLNTHVQTCSKWCSKRSSYLPKTNLGHSTGQSGQSIHGRSFVSKSNQTKSTMSSNQSSTAQLEDSLERSFPWIDSGFDASLVINHVFEGILLNSGGDELLSKQTNYLRGKLRFLLKAYPRTFFLEDHFQPVKGRNIVQYPAEFSDATQLYDTKDSGDAAIMESMERKFFPEHEINKDCVPISELQKSNFRK
jgi:hypothetical protein